MIWWNATYVLYVTAIVVCIFWQAGHVSQMNIKKLALEGGTSVRVSLMQVVVTLCHIFIVIIFAVAGNYGIVLIVNVLGSITFPIITVAMIFSPKVLILCVICQV